MKVVKVVKLVIVLSIFVRIFFGKSGGASWGRACYQRGLTRLVFIQQNIFHIILEDILIGKAFEHCKFGGRTPDWPLLLKILFLPKVLLADRSCYPLQKSRINRFDFCGRLELRRLDKQMFLQRTVQCLQTTLNNESCWSWT